MKISNLSKSAVAALVLMAAPFSLRAGSFEGKIDMTITVPQKPKESMTLHYTLKDRRLRYDMPSPARDGRDSGSVAMVINYDTREMVTLIDSVSNGEEHKIAMRRALPTPQEAAALAGSHGGSNGEGMAAPVATGKSTTILGYTANEYMMTTKKGEEVDMWMGKGLGNFMSGGGGAGGFGGRHAQASPEWEAFAQNAGLFPLRVVTHDKGGKETMHMEVTKIDKTSVPDSAFSTEGYQEMQLPSFGQMFGH